LDINAWGELLDADPYRLLAGREEQQRTKHKAAHVILQIPAYSGIHEAMLT
jgi:hypothetical protein